MREVRRARELLGAALILLLPAASASRTWRVKADGSGEAPTIQAAIDSAASGDSILMAAGTYRESALQIFIGKRLFLRGVSGAEATVIDAERHNPVLRMFGGGSVEGFTLRNGLTPTAGGGLDVGSSTPTVIRHNIIENNQAGLEYDTGFAGGVYLRPGASPVLLEANVIRGNVATYSGGGIWDDGGFPTPHVIRGNTIVGNSALVLGGGIVALDAVIENNFIAGNDGHYGGGGIFAPEGWPQIRGNTITANTTCNGSLHGAGIVVGNHAPAVISHNIVTGHHSCGLGGATAAGIVVGSEAVVECNDVWGNDIDEIIGLATGSDNFAADPQFCAVDPAGSLNFFLQSDSPCAPGNDPSGGACGLVGAARVGCGTVAVQHRTWSDVKALYRK
jgi:hypothetical protein